MEHLTKQQIVLLTLLVSFVTSLATGITTVTLMDQGHLDITQVINNFERTAEASPVTQPAAAAEPTLAQITTKVSKNVVELKARNSDGEKVLGLGIILSPVGLIVTDKTNLLASSSDVLGKNITAQLPTGEVVPLQVVQSQVSGNVAFAALLLPTGLTLTPVTSPSSLSSTHLGDSVYSLTGEDASVLEEGIIKKMPAGAAEKIETTIKTENILPGSPLFNSKGQVIGFKTSDPAEEGIFHSLPALKSITPQLSR